MKHIIEEKDKEIMKTHNEMMDARLELGREIKANKEKDSGLTKNQSLLLDKDRQILELQKMLSAERKRTDDLRSELRTLKKL